MRLNARLGRPSLSASLGRTCFARRLVVCAAVLGVRQKKGEVNKPAARGIVTAGDAFGGAVIVQRIATDFVRGKPEGAAKRLAMLWTIPLSPRARAAKQTPYGNKRNFTCSSLSSKDKRLRGMLRSNSEITPAPWADLVLGTKGSVSSHVLCSGGFLDKN